MDENDDGMIIERLEFPNEDSRQIDIVSDLSKDQLDSKDMILISNPKADQSNFSKLKGMSKMEGATTIQSALGEKKDLDVNLQDSQMLNDIKKRIEKMNEQR